MANLKISQLPEVTTAASSANVAIVSGGVTSKITASNLKLEGIRRAEHSVLNITTSQTVNLSTLVSVNVLVVDNPGLTLTIQFPTSPVEAQVCQFTTLRNTVTLVAGSGTFNPSFAGAPVAGFKATYAYHETDSTWYLIG